MLFIFFVFAASPAALTFFLQLCGRRRRWDEQPHAEDRRSRQRGGSVWQQQRHGARAIQCAAQYRDGRHEQALGGRQSEQEDSGAFEARSVCQLPARLLLPTQHRDCVSQLFDESLSFLALWTMPPPSSPPSSSSRMSPYGLSFVRQHPSLPATPAVVVAFTNDDATTGMCTLAAANERRALMLTQVFWRCLLLLPPATFKTCSR